LYRLSIYCTNHLSGISIILRYIKHLSGVSIIHPLF
jgi:hypothetical protein